MGVLGRAASRAAMLSVMLSVLRGLTGSACTLRLGEKSSRTCSPVAALGCAQARAQAQDAGGQDLGDLGEALGRGHGVGVAGRLEHAAVDGQPAHFYIAR